MKNLPIGIQTFEEIINNNYLYIDKTKQIEKLINSGKYFFLSRPRRFGKSLLLSTLKEVFSGNKELFKGLFIYDKIKWEIYPVIHLDVTSFQYNDTLEIFNDSIIEKLNRTAQLYNHKLSYTKSVKSCFEELIKKLSEQNKVVILIDEYDKPIVDFITNKEKATINRNLLRDFYSVIKANDQYVKFAFLTGVSKFSKVSLFSGLNNLKDITMNSEFSTICGYTQEEFEYYFADRFEETAKILGYSIEQLKAEVKLWYNGYSWDGINKVYNPYSILNFFQDKKFGNYWFTTGTPTFLVEKFIADKITVTDLTAESFGEHFFEKFDVDSLDYRLLLFQTGYLTVKEYDKEFNLYNLDFPNKEVRDSLLLYLSTVYLEKDINNMDVLISKVNGYLKRKDYEMFFNSLKSIISSIPYTIKREDEAYYHSVFYIIMLLMGAKIDIEKLTSKGRIDGVVENKDIIYIIEIKHIKEKSNIKNLLNTALAQIKEKEYFAPYLAKGKEIMFIALAVNDNVLEYKIE